MKKIIVAHGHTSIEVFHSMVPIILSSKKKDDWKWEFIDYRFSNILRKQGDLLILIRKYQDLKTNALNIASELLELRKNFSKIIYFDDSAASSVVIFSAFPYVDQYWKRSCLSDTSLYEKKFYGGHLFSHYYHSEFGIDDGNQIFFNSVINNKIDLNKLKISWNIGIGIYPLNGNSILDKHYPLVRRIITGMSILPSIEPIYFLISHYIKKMKEELKKEICFNSKLRKFSSRFHSPNYRNSVSYQRNLLLKKIKENKNFLIGHKSKRDFTQEIYEVFGVLSPFGWGEICYRDFEAALGGSYLIKPDMSHISTWPNIYSKNMYYSLSWDFSDLDNLDYLFEKAKECEDSVNRARKEYLSSINESIARCIRMIEDVI
jgi:hypothetical protein